MNTGAVSPVALAAQAIDSFIISAGFPASNAAGMMALSSEGGKLTFYRGLHQAALTHLINRRVLEQSKFHLPLSAPVARRFGTRLKIPCSCLTLGGWQMPQLRSTPQTSAFATRRPKTADIRTALGCWEKTSLP